MTPPDTAKLADELSECDWPVDQQFTFLDEPGEHDPCYVVMPGGAMLPLNHHAGEGVDIARAKFIVAACNAALAPGMTREAVARIVCCPNGCILSDADGGCIALEPKYDNLKTADKICALSLYPSPAVGVREALLAAKEHFDAEFSESCDLKHKNRISALCDKIDAALASLPAQSTPAVGSLSEHLERTLSQYDKTIDRANDDSALSDTGRETVINACIAAKAAVKIFAERLALASLPAQSGGGT